MRRIPGQIPETVGRLLGAGHIRRAPTWFAPVLANPPPVIAPLRQKHVPPPPTGRQAKGSFRTPRLRIANIHYEQDEIRKRFFIDFPFEAMRPTSLLEMRHVREDDGVSGEEWVALEQRGAYPTVEECVFSSPLSLSYTHPSTVDFTVHLKNNAGLSKSQAYTKATGEFVYLRGQHEMATLAAEMEARHWGAEFKESPFERYNRLQRKALDEHVAANKKRDQLAASASTRVRWVSPKKRRWTTHVPEGALPADDFSGGRRYVERWLIPSATPLEEGSAEEGVVAAETSPEPAAEAAENGAEPVAEEDMDDLEFLQQALGRSNRQ